MPPWPSTMQMVNSAPNSKSPAPSSSTLPAWSISRLMTIAWLILGTIQTASAVEATNAGAEVSATARVGTSHCWTQPTTCQWMDFRDTAVFSPWVQATPTNTVSARAAIDVRAHGPGNGHGLESEPEPLQWSLRVQDIWVATLMRIVDCFWLLRNE